MVTSKRTPAFFPAFTAVMASAAALAASLAFAATFTPAQAQSALAGIESQIQRYGCNLPQYANSVPGCRDLHARARALRSGSGYYGSGGAPYGAGSPPPRVQPAQSSGGGLFSSLFGGGSSNSYSSRSRYGTHGSGGNWGRSHSPYAGGYGRYRTLCVRTCDGYYFPISFSASRSGLARDAKRCEASCGAPAKLFYHRNPGADVEHMVSLDGERYATMENAFRYREEYVQDCRCKPEPWSEAAKEMYQQRAEAAENPNPVKTAAGQTVEQTSTQTPSAPSAWRTRDHAQPAPRRRVQKVDPAYEGRWWAGSW